MAEGIKLEKQKGVQKRIFASNAAAALWPGTRYKMLAECPYLMPCWGWQLITAVAYLSVLFTNFLSEYNNLQIFISVMVSMMLCDEVFFPVSLFKSEVAEDFIPSRLTI